MLTRNVAKQAHDIDRLQNVNALRDQEIDRLRSSLSASAEEFALLRPSGISSSGTVTLN